MNEKEEEDHISTVRVGIGLDDFWFNTINDSETTQKCPAPVIQVRINGKELDLIVDTGDCTNEISNKQLSKCDVTDSLQPVNMTLLDVNNRQLNIIGKTYFASYT